MPPGHLDTLGVVEAFADRDWIGNSRNQADRGLEALSLDRRPRSGFEVLALTAPGVRLRAYAVRRRGRAGSTPLALVLDRMANAGEHR